MHPEGFATGQQDHVSRRPGPRENAGLVIKFHIVLLPSHVALANVTSKFHHIVARVTKFAGAKITKLCDGSSFSLKFPFYT
jgi:hypothetical protein